MNFRAYCRGIKLVLRGKVPVSAMKEGPYLQRLAEPRTDTRSFQLLYRVQRQGRSPYAETLELPVHIEPEMPEHVRRIRIKLANDQEFVIGSAQRNPA